MVLCQTLYGQQRLVAPDQLTFRPSVYALIPHQRAIALVTLRSTGKYGLPGGAARVAESLDQALQREVQEETGLRVTVQRLLHFKETFFYYDPTATAYHTLSFFYLCHPETVILHTDAEVEDGDTPEAGQPRWIDRETLRTDDIQGFFVDAIALLPRGVATHTPQEHSDSFA